MNTYRVYLRPRSSIGTWPMSDTLFGAMCWAVYHLYGKEKLENILNDYHANPKFIVSSAFPFLERPGSLIHFYPKPMIAELTVNEVEALTEKEIAGNVAHDSLIFKRKIITITEKLKSIKRAAFVSESIFTDIVRGEDMTSLYERLNTGQIVSRGGILMTSEESLTQAEESFFIQQDALKNQIDRVTGATVEGLLFLKRETFFRTPRTGLWFVLQTDDTDFVIPLLKYLQDTGIGSDRTTGKGHFDIEFGSSFDLPKADNPDSFIILSRWCPEEKERNFTGGFACWNLVNMRPIRETMYCHGKKRILKDLIRMFAEGSVFPIKLQNKSCYGMLVESKMEKDYKVYHNGVAIPVYAKTGGQT